MRPCGIPLFVAKLLFDINSDVVPSAHTIALLCALDDMGAGRTIRHYDDRDAR